MKSCQDAGDNLRSLVDGHDIRVVHLDGNRAHNQIERDDKAEAVLLPHDDAFQASQRTTYDAHPPAHRQIRMRLSLQLCCQSSLENFHLIIRKGCRLTVETDKPNDAGNLKYTKPVAQR